MQQSLPRISTNPLSRKSSVISSNLEEILPRFISKPQRRLNYHKDSEFSHQNSSKQGLSKVRQQEGSDYILMKCINLKELKNHSQLSQFLGFNTFFRKLGSFLTKILLMNSKMILKQKGKYLFKRNQPIKSIYIIIYGKIKIKRQNPKYDKYLVSGETLCQQILFQFVPSIHPFSQKQLPFMDHKYSAICLSKCAFLKLTKNSYELLNKCLCAQGFKNDSFKLQNSFKHNFLTKQRFNNGRLQQHKKNKTQC